MASFCGKCGSPLIDGAVFCGGCGSSVPQGPQAAAQADLPSTPVNKSIAENATVTSTQASAIPATKSSNSLLKVVAAFVVIIFVGGLVALAAIYYGARRVSEKIHAVSQQTLGTEKPGGGEVASIRGGGSGITRQETQGPRGDMCRFLSKQDVSTYTGAKIIRADSSEDGCVYIANGDPADAITKHLGGMLAQKGADPKSQQMMQQIAGGFFQQQEHDDKALSAEAKKGEIPIISINFSSGHAVSEMKLNHKLMARMNSEDLAGIGDEAFDSADGIMTVRKGNTLFRITYISCPCTSDAIKPLAQKLANAL